MLLHPFAIQACDSNPSHYIDDNGGAIVLFCKATSSVLLLLLYSLSHGTPNPSFDLLGHFHPDGDIRGLNHLNVIFPCESVIFSNIFMSRFIITTIDLTIVQYKIRAVYKISVMELNTGMEYWDGYFNAKYL